MTKLVITETLLSSVIFKTIMVPSLLANSLENYYKFAKDSLPKDIGS